MPVKNTTRKINNKKSKNIKSYKHNKYETSKIIKNFKLVKMPEINTEFIESKYLLFPLKNIKTNKESINNEEFLNDEFNNISNIEKKYKLDPTKDFYTYINFAWMKQQSIVMDYKNYYFIKYSLYKIVYIKYSSYNYILFFFFISFCVFFN